MSGEDIQPDPGSIEKVKHWRKPQSAAELRSFLGLASYYRKFCEGLQRLHQNFTSLQKRVADGIGMMRFIHVLTSPPLLAYQDFEKPFVMQCDASDNAVGVVLAQINNRKEQGISYGSKALEKKQKQWIPCDREWQAFLWETLHFRPYVAGTNFQVFTDHKPLVGKKNIDPG